MKGFASDNIAGVHPAVMEALIQANQGHAVPYGDDDISRRTIEKFRQIFGAETDVFFVFNGTAANVLSLAAAARPFQSVLCADSAHINVDECGAPEKFTGCKLVSLPSDRGKLSTALLEPEMVHVGFEHHSQPGVISITQPTELGQVYQPEEILEITGFARRNNLKVHMDGARIANAAAFLGKGLKAITRDLGIDILSFGGTKNGAMFGEAVVFFDQALAADFRYIRKQGMQLGSKLRFVAAQFEALLENDLWLENARHANAMAALLHRRIRDCPLIRITGKVETNAVFAVMPPDMIRRLQQETFFYTWDEEISEVRLMTCFDTTEEDVESFSALVRQAARAHQADNA